MRAARGGSGSRTYRPPPIRSVTQTRPPESTNRSLIWATGWPVEVRVGEHGFVRGLDPRGGEQRGIGDAAREREDVRLVEQLQEFADFAGPDPAHAVGEAFGPVGGGL